MSYKKFNWDFLSKDGIAPTKATVKNAVEMSKNVIALEFDSEVLVNQPPVLKLANGNFATFLTQYDSKTLLFAASKEDIGQEITEIIDGAIESMHNLPVSLEGAGVPGGKNGAKAAIHEVPDSQVQSMVKVQFMRIQSLKVASTVRKQPFMMCQNSQVVLTR